MRLALSLWTRLAGHEAGAVLVGAGLPAMGREAALRYYWPLFKRLLNSCGQTFIK